LFATLGIPDTGGVVGRGSEDLLSISAEGRAADRAAMASQAHELFAALGIPDTGRARLSWRRNHPQAIRTGRHALQQLRPAFHRPDFCSGLGVENTDRIVVAERHHPHSVRAERWVHLIVIMAFDDEELRAVLGIPDAGSTVLRRCQHPTAIWAEGCAPDHV